MAYLPAASAYGEYIDLQNYTGTAPTNSGSLYMSGSDSDPALYVNINMNVAGTFDATGNITSDGQISGSTFALPGGNAAITALLDEDGMDSNSATALATQQSIKAYVDAQVTLQDLDFQGDSGGALSIDLDSEVLDIAGGTGIDTAGSGNTLTVAIDSTVATLTGTQTLANKTLTSPDVNTPDIDGGTIDGATIATSDVTVGSGKTLNVSAGTLTTSAAQNLAIMQAAAANVDIGAYEMRAQTFESDVTTGTAPLVVASTTEVANLNAAKLSGADWDAPLAIGGTTPAAGSFTAVVGTTGTYSSTLAATGNVSGSASGSFLNGNFEETLEVGGATALNGATTAAAITMDGILSCSAGVEFDSTLDVGAASTFAAASFSGVAAANGGLTATTGDFSGNCTFDGNITLGNASSDVTTVTSQLTCSQGAHFSAPLTVDAGGIDVVGNSSLEGNLTLREADQVKAGSYVTYSDLALKTNVETVTNAMDMIQGLRGVSYEMKHNGRREYGFIAQEVDTVVPEVVSKSGKLMGIDYTRITSLLVEAVKTQQAQIEDLKAKLDK